MPVLFVLFVVLIGSLLVGTAATLFTEPRLPYEQAVQRRYERHAELTAARLTFIGEHGRSPTTHELWTISPPRMENS